MPELLVHVLPFALGAAISPTVWAIELLILTGKQHAKARAWSFVGGFAVVLVVVLLVFTTLLRNLTTSGGGPSPLSRGLDVAFALLLIGAGLRQLHPSKTSGEKQQSKLQQRLATGGLATYAVIGMIAMLTDASTIIMLLPGTHEIARSDASADIVLAAEVMLFVIVMIPILLPVGLLTIAGHRADTFLVSVNTWVTKHQRLINALVCFLIGALVGYGAFK